MKRGPVPFSTEELAFVRELHDLPRVVLHAWFVTTFERDDIQLLDLNRLCKRHGWIKRTCWPAEADAVVREHYPHVATHKVAARLQRSTLSVYQRARKLGLFKSDAYLASPDACRLRRGDNVGAAFRFKKGQTPQNKGKKMPKGWAPGRMRETQFVPGQKGSKYMAVGSTRLIDGYEYTKISDVPKVPYTVNWKPTHILRWEALNGPLPKGHALKSLDSNRLNTDPMNWECVPRAVLLRLNGTRGERVSYDQAPVELRPTLMRLAKLEHAAHRRTRDSQRASA